MRLIPVIAMIGLIPGIVAPAQDPMPDDSPLDAARLAYQDASEAAKTKLINALRARQGAAKKAGELRAHDAIGAEIEAFERDDAKLPSALPAALQDYQKAIIRARAAMTGTFEKVIREMTRQGKLDEARAAQAEIDYRRHGWEGRKGKDGDAPEPARWIDPVGRPAEFRAGQLPRYAIWVDEQGWHLRVTDKGGGNRPFSGRIEVADGEITAVRSVADGPGPEDDKVTPTPDRSAIDFLLHPHGGEDGFDFNVAGADAVVQFRLLFSRKPDGVRIGIGRRNANPGESTFRLQTPRPTGR